MSIRYTETHEWVRLEGDVATVGITPHAAEELGEVVFAEGKDEGLEVVTGDVVAVVESVKAASDIYAPLNGILTAFNEKLTQDPALVNSDPEGEGWIVQMKVTEPQQWEALLTPEQYKARHG
ncbi:glycine cleavage system protein GcvH [Oecophyllibacter saccharovorans]|uniref:glycine cleavage system protein GcvH n=1 Tax=Oecophyllibacter saccharovorans TaxID=2558360 RepID=UPI001142F2E5|nr:glycine cleavage system protein GcvH [Oecophyllibacter saccharovorans]QDH15177.1 glycine cleavage system protein GcvH [Oecophyllibacter saccharovorans]